MNYRLNKKAIILVVLLVCVAIILFAYTLVSAPTETDLEPGEQATTSSSVDPNTVVTAKHAYRDGLHAVAGHVSVPTSCHSISAEPFFVDDGTSVEIRLNTVMQGDVCTPQVTDVPFKVTFKAPEDVSIGAVWDGTAIRLNLVPVGPNESVDGMIPEKG
jgi:hypothetical protein